VGSRSSNEKAYIAGFLDGDGSVMLQIKKRSDTKRSLRFMATICLYQDTRHEKPLHWMRDRLGIGYVSKRNDGMSELRINGFSTVRSILEDLYPYIRFKKVQSKALITACRLLERKNINMLSKKQLRCIVDQILIIQNENYVTRNKRTGEELLLALDLTP
jgi:LAGLIDADG endonuclease